MATDETRPTLDDASRALMATHRVDAEQAAHILDNYARTMDISDEEAAEFVVSTGGTFLDRPAPAYVAHPLDLVDRGVEQPHQDISWAREVQDDGFEEESTG